MVVWHCIKAVHPLTLLVPPLAAEHTATLSKLPLSPAEAAERLPEMQIISFTANTHFHILWESNTY
eukprot:3644213-Rhodomonas_salina.5